MQARLGLYLALVAPLAASAASAQQSLLPVVARVVESADRTTFTITGTGFGASAPLVTLAGTTLKVLSTSNTQIQAALPSSLAPGSYLLGVQNGGTHLFGLFLAAVEPAPGPAGPAGPQGVPGAGGPVGAPGVAGTPGAAGPVGPVGAAGAAGPAGTPGAAGPAGAPGAMGQTGLAGAAGPIGPQGATGVAGAAGQIGPVGTQGLQGQTGAPGMTGAVGPAGPTGADGLPGAAGPTGAQGPTGPAGAQGAAGTPTQVYSSNFLVPASGSIVEGSLIGVSNGTSTDVAVENPQSALLLPSSCATVIPPTYVVFGAQGSNPVKISIARYDQNGQVARVQASCVVVPNNGHPSPALRSPALRREDTSNPSTFKGPSRQTWSAHA